MLARLAFLFCLLFAGSLHAQSIGGVQGISSAQGKAAGRTSQLQINIVYDPTSVAPANFPGSSNISEAQFKAAAAEAVATLTSALYLKATLTIEFYWVSTGTQFFMAGCTLLSGAGSENCTEQWSLLSWSAFLSELNTNAITTNAKTAYSNLPVSNPLPGGVPPITTFSGSIAFGLNTTGGPGSPDCAVAVNKGLNFTPTQNGGAGPIAAGTYDLVGFMMHELTECMGRYRYAGTDSIFYTPLDAMAYSSAATLNFTTTGTAYFSVDGGVTNINTFNQGAGDKMDWSGVNGADSFNNTTLTGNLDLLTIGDIREMDALGYQCGSC